MAHKLPQQRYLHVDQLWHNLRVLLHEVRDDSAPFYFIIVNSMLLHYLVVLDVILVTSIFILFRSISLYHR